MSLHFQDFTAKALAPWGPEAGYSFQLLSDMEKIAGATCRIYSDTESSGGLPVFFPRSWFGKVRAAACLPFGLYCRPLVDASPRLPDLAGMRGRPVVIQNPYWEPALAGAVGVHRLVDAYTHVIELRGKSISEVDSEYFDSDLRYSLRRAQRSGLRFEVGNRAEIVHDFFRVHSLSSSRWGRRRTRFSREFFLSVSRCPWTAFRVAYLGKQPIAGILTATLGAQDFYWAAGSDKHYTRLCAGHWLLREAIAAAIERGAFSFNFGASGQLESVRKFKESFGARELRYGIYLAGPAILAKALSLSLRGSAMASSLRRELR